MTTHTPGPWQLARPNWDYGTVEIETVQRGTDVPAQGNTIGYVYGDLDSATARLIAAAPDLLAALEHLVNDHETMAAVLNSHGYTIYHAVSAPKVKDARAAIAKATA